MNKFWNCIYKFFLLLITLSMIKVPNNKRSVNPSVEVTLEELDVWLEMDDCTIVVIIDVVIIVVIEVVELT